MSKKKAGENHEPVLCDFNYISLKVKRSKLMTIYSSSNLLSHYEKSFLKALLWNAEAEENKLRHIKSICERALLRGAIH